MFMHILFFDSIYSLKNGKWYSLKKKKNKNHHMAVKCFTIILLLYHVGNLVTAYVILFMFLFI